MKAYDAENQKYVFDILDSNGWPTGLSKNASNTIYLVIDHAEIADQKKYLHLVKKQSESGVIGKDKYPTMLNGILVSEQKRQIYGTQTKSITRNDARIVYVYPVEDYQNIDSLRESVGLPPLDVYMQILELTLNAKVQYVDNIDLLDTH